MRGDQSLLKTHPDIGMFCVEPKQLSLHRGTDKCIVTRTWEATNTENMQCFNESTNNKKVHTKPKIFSAHNRFDVLANWSFPSVGVRFHDYKYLPWLEVRATSAHHQLSLGFTSSPLIAIQIFPRTLLQSPFTVSIWSVAVILLHSFQVSCIPSTLL